ncbi:ABC transporter permease [Thermobifida halotolerans]|uniref:ABC transporter permease n=1 Tax=Thermobifida halotolerans TaxID=483545 RepID=A0A399G6T0_9ACTN|nr:ABC transporter permease [Thermobifida halotolerans]UOE20791.1 ABC transporter permease [Thermobifida halotolerans]
MSDIQARTGAPTPRTGPKTDTSGTVERGQLHLVLSRFVRHRMAMTSLVVFALTVLFAFAGPLLWPWDHTVHREIMPNQPPSWAHPFGTTNAGHDVFGQVMRGTQQTIRVALTVSVLATALGAVWGAVAGYYRGWVDSVMMRTVDVLMVVPLLVAVAAIGGNVRGGTTWWAVALIIALFSWTTIARVVRGVVLSLREQEFVEAARAAGASDARIVLRHLLPNAAGPVIVAATLLVATAILLEASMSFLGFGIQAPDISLGLMINNARTAAFTRPWLFYPPGLFIVLICLTINFIGDGLRDALDPRQTMVRR